MDKYEFNIKVEQIKKLVNKNDFATAMKIADTIDWRRVRNANLLSMISQVYEKNREYQEAKEVLLLAYERAPIGKRLLYKLTELALREGSISEAEDYYREFCDLAPEDSRQHILRYLILKEKKAPIDQLIHALERYTAVELDEKWLYELADLYARAGRSTECVQLCDKMILLFGVGTYVERAMDLKQRYAPLNNYQRDLAENKEIYEERLRAVEQEYENGILGGMQDYVNQANFSGGAGQSRTALPAAERLYQSGGAYQTQAAHRANEAYGGRENYDTKGTYDSGQNYGAGGGYGGQRNYEAGTVYGAGENYGTGAAAYGGEGSYGAGVTYGDQGSYEAGGAAYGDQGSYGAGVTYGGQGSYGAEAAYGDQGSYGAEAAYGDQGSYGVGEGYGDQGNYETQDSYGAQANYGFGQGAVSGQAYGVEKDYGREPEDEAEGAYQTDSRYIEENSAYGSDKDGTYLVEDRDYEPEEVYESEQRWTEDEMYGQRRTKQEPVRGQRPSKTWTGPLPVQGNQRMDEEIVANLHQAAAEQELAAEMSRISASGYREPDFPSGHTKIFGERNTVRPRPYVRRQTAEDIERENAVYHERSYIPHHLMIEAKTPKVGFGLAIDILKQIHQENGVNNQVIKITGGKLSHRGIFNVADKLAGKDLIVEEAGDLTQQDVEELQMLLERDETGMIVVLIDNPYQMKELHQQNPGFINLFKCIDADEKEEEEAGSRQEESSQDTISEETVEEVSEPEVWPEPEEEEEPELPEEEPEADTEGDPEEETYSEEDESQEEYTQDEDGYEDGSEEEYPEDEYPEDEGGEYESDGYEDGQYDDSGYSDGEYEEDQYEDGEYEEPYEEDSIDDEELDLKEFADYAVDYAKEIDCSITGKSMLALYERIEIMEEDGIPLTRTNAEDLIEEAADKAEKPSLGGLIKGVFSSKYDKDGLLILKEEHFI